MAAPAGSGSWLTLISGVAAGEPSGGGEGLLFPFAGALSLQRERRESEPDGGRLRRPRGGEETCVCDRLCARTNASGTRVWKCACTCVCVHVDPGRLRALVCPDSEKI